MKFESHEKQNQVNIATIKELQKKKKTVLKLNTRE